MSQSLARGRTATSPWTSAHAHTIRLLSFSWTEGGMSRAVHLPRLLLFCNLDLSLSGWVIQRKECLYGMKWHEIAQVKRENSSFLPLFIPGVTPYGTVASQIDLWTSFSLLQRVHLYMCVMFLSLETEVAVSELLRGSFLYLSGIGCL